MAKFGSNVIDLELGGRVYHLQFTLQAFSIVEEKTGSDFIRRCMDSADNPDNFSFSFRDIHALTWGAMQRHQPHLSFKKVGEMIENGQDFAATTKAVTGALAAFFPSDEGTAGNGEGESPAVD